LVRKEALEQAGFFSEDREVVTAEDYDLWLKLARNERKICFIDEMLGEYHLHDNNESKNVEKNTKAIIRVLENHFMLFEDKSAINCWKLRRAKAKVLSGAGRNLFRDRRFSEAAKYAVKAIRMWPFEFKPYLVLAGSLVSNCLRQLFGYWR
jgi:hypothetical protein